MIKIPKKVTVCILALAIMMAGATAKAATLDELQAQVDALKVQINQLISMIAAMNETQTNSQSSATTATDTNLAEISFVDTSTQSNSAKGADAENAAGNYSSGTVSQNGSNPIQTPSNMREDGYVISPTAGTNGCVNNEETVFTDITTKCCDGYKITTYSSCSLTVACKSPTQYRCVKGPYINMDNGQLDNSDRIVNNNSFNGIIRYTEGCTEYTYIPGKCFITDVFSSSNNVTVKYKFQTIVAGPTILGGLEALAEQTTTATDMNLSCLANTPNPTIAQTAACGIAKNKVFACYSKNWGTNSKNYGECSGVITHPIRFFDPICGNKRCEAAETSANCAMDCGNGSGGHCSAAGGQCVLSTESVCSYMSSRIKNEIWTTGWLDHSLTYLDYILNGCCCSGLTCQSSNVTTGYGTCK
ncbi:MAG: hypothetical protein L7H18_02205 [Candidatus Nealsonbacteria bacterium DGGOD1a]|jgi:hypothetical protein|nr:MAG: hypothetical protein L7H18_02205 [Candidatus Nealsonbacteria bacterium DGGOD1a]